MKIYEIEAGEKQKFEPSNSDENRTFQKFLSDCSDSIAAMQSANKFIFRGTSSFPSEIFIGKSRDNRNSLSYVREESKIIDFQFEQDGFDARRTNSIFCSGSGPEAGSYGKLYMIFPINGFKFTWSPMVVDFATNASINKHLSHFHPLSYGYTNKNLVAAIKSKNEIMINGSYYAFSFKEYWKPLSEYFGFKK
jgi:hypothetical protein